MSAIVPTEGVLLGRVRVAGTALPRVATVRNGRVLDITSKAAPTARDICEPADPGAYVAAAVGTDLGSVDELIANSWAGHMSDSKPSLLSPIDLQAVKAAGVTFVVSLLERVIEEQARGDKAKVVVLCLVF